VRKPKAKLKVKGVPVRGRAEIIEGTRVRFICPLGHSQIEDVNREGLPLNKRIGPSTLRLLINRWSRPNDGVTFTCRTCTREAQRLKALTDPRY
jgi:hypothetical protein